MLRMLPLVALSIRQLNTATIDRLDHVSTPQQFTSRLLIETGLESSVDVHQHRQREALARFAEGGGVRAGQRASGFLKPALDLCHRVGTGAILFEDLIEKR